MHALLVLLSLAHAHATQLPTLRRSKVIGQALTLRGGNSAPPTYVSSVKTPKDAYDFMAEKGAANAKMSVAKILHQSVMGGCYVGFGGLLSLSIAGSLARAVDGNPGLGKLVFAALFPVNLLLILMSGGQLFTGNSASVPAALCEGLVSKGELVKSWVVSYLGNICGCGLFALAASYTGLLTGGTAELAAATAVKKCAGRFGPTLVKAVMCNWLVCMAVFLAGAANDLGGKMVGIWFPISTFVAIGFEHSVANLFLLPLGCLAGADVSLSEIVFKNLLPVTIGNAIAGALVIGAGYSYAFGKLGQ